MRPVSCDDDELSFYSTPGPMTALDDLDSAVVPLLDGLPEDPGRIRDLIPGLVIHGDLRWLYGIDGPPPLAEMNTRKVTDVLRIIAQRSSLPLAVARPPEARMVGMCCQYVRLFCALARRAGIPARARCGFASYYPVGEWVDHWNAQYWDRERRRWVWVDPQLDREQIEKFDIPFGPVDLPEGRFLPAEQVWLSHRAGELDAERFGFGDLHGPWFVAGSVMRSLAAWNKVEILCWDNWALLDGWTGRDDLVDVEQVDRVAAALAAGSGTAGSLARIRQLYRDEPGAQVPTDLVGLHAIRDG
jgi:hypothetical protein